MQYFQKEIETMSPDQKKVLQSERLVKMVKYVYENQKPYRAKMDAIKLKPSDIKSIDDIYKLPYTVKQDLRDAYPFGMMARPRKDLVRLHASSATTGRRMSVTAPLALYCLTTISVAAGAVADATAPRMMAAERENLSGKHRCTAIRTISTTAVVNTACTIPMTVACLPIFLSCE